MNQERHLFQSAAGKLDTQKFRHPTVTAKGEERAEVALEQLETLWINTGTLCNITCQHCYIESSPENDRLVYFSIADALALFDEIADLKLPTKEIGFTGGEPFMNPDAPAMIAAALERGFKVLVLTNAMQPMMRKKVQEQLLRIQAEFGEALSLRVSIDHYLQAAHDAERGSGAYDKTIAGINWLNDNGFSISIAGRTCWQETEAQAREGFRQLIAQHGWRIDADNRSQLVLFPEMDAMGDVPEITTGCWKILGKSPQEMMCAKSRMAVKRRGDEHITILPCTLLAYDEAFNMGASLAQSLKANGGNCRNGAVKLNHPHCAQFCVLGGASCAPD